VDALVAFAAALVALRLAGALRARGRLAWAGAFLLGLIAGPAAGTFATWSLRAPFFIYAVTLVFAGGFGLGMLRRSDLAARLETADAPMSLRSALRQRSYVAVLVVGFAGDFAVVGERDALATMTCSSPTLTGFDR